MNLGIFMLSMASSVTAAASYTLRTAASCSYAAGDVLNCSAYMMSSFGQEIQGTATWWYDTCATDCQVGSSAWTGWKWHGISDNTEDCVIAWTSPGIQRYGVMVDTGACDSLYGRSWISPYVEKCLIPFGWEKYISFAECHARFRGLGKGIKNSTRRGRIPISTGGKSALFEGQELHGSEPGILGLASLISKRAIINLTHPHALKMEVDNQGGEREDVPLYLACIWPMAT